MNTATRAPALHYLRQFQISSAFYSHRRLHFVSLQTQPHYFPLKHQNLSVVQPVYALKGNHPAGYTINTGDSFDPKLRAVLELATDSELYELERILFGPSYWSPLLKSITNREYNGFAMLEDDFNEREAFISMLESRFLYLAADAQSTLRGRRPSYRDALLNVRKKLNVRCSAKISVEDLEAEIFLHLLHEYSSSTKLVKTANENASLEFGLSQGMFQAEAALKGGQGQLGTMILKGGGMLTLGRIYNLLVKRLFGKCMMEVAKYGVQKEILQKGGRLAALNLESRMAFFAAKESVKEAAASYLGLRSMGTFLGPLLWGTFIADIFIQMIGTDYARILRAIFAFAQIRIIRTHKC
ncbi:unnamed protein product [Cuscuta epithymum]|uniref:Uncharacterized protein n=1 Tax=Cuscuta epithymum TaxID=186058 RepID=A0AAV0G3C9_9ASTE|nr:unnamed protein product [Cuscuta epithymum]